MADTEKVVDSPQVSKQTQTNSKSDNQLLSCKWRRLETIGDVPPGRSSCAAGVVGSKLVIFSGEQVSRIPVDGHIYVLDLSKEQPGDDGDSESPVHRWYCIPEQAESWPLPRVGPCSAVTGDKLLMYGGRIGKDLGDQSMGDFWQLNFTKVNQIINRAKKLQGQQDDQSTDEAADESIDHSLDESTSFWTPLTIEGTPPPPLSYASMVAGKDKVYVLNGATVSHGLTNDIWYYDFDKKRWDQETFKEMFGSPQSKRPHPSKRSGAAGVHSQEGLHVLFGLDGKEELQDHWLWDFEVRDWRRFEREPIAPPARSVSQAVFLPKVGSDGSIFVCCGESSPAENSDLSSEFHHDCWLFDIANKSWKQLEMGENAPSARGWFNACALQDGRSVVLFGGYDGQQRFNDVYIFSLE